MNEAIGHRGPDASCHNVYNNVALGHRRLSIIDINKRSNQPMNFNGNYLIYNGEIFNFKTNKIHTATKSFDTNSDTEAILKVYR